VQADGKNKVINFHLDHSPKTMQVALNDEGEYEGGRLVYVTEAGLELPLRKVGSATLHDNSVAHGVSELTAGVRYGLFFLQLPLAQ